MSVEFLVGFVIGCFLGAAIGTFVVGMMIATREEHHYQGH